MWKGIVGATLPGFGALGRPGRIDMMRAMPPRRPDAVLFDNDGLLLDTESVWTRAEQDIFERRGHEFTAAHKRETHRHIRPRSPAKLLERGAGSEPGRAVELIEELERAGRRRARARGGGDGRRPRPARTAEGPGDADRPRLQLAARLRRALAGDRRLRSDLRHRRQRPRSGGAEAGARSLPGGLPSPRGRGGTGRDRAGGLADRRRRRPRRGPDRDRRALGRRASSWSKPITSRRRCSTRTWSS